AQAGLATGCYRYILTGTDNVGNTTTITTVVKVDTTAPAAPGLTLADSSADVHTTGTTAFYRPAGAGSFDVTASSTDGQSGILDYAFPALTGFTGSGAGVTRTYTLATPTEPDGSKPVTARNQALLNSAATNFTLTADAAVPTGGALTVNGTVATGGGSGSYDDDGSVTIGLRTDYNADIGAGVGTSILTREDGTLNADACSAYGAPTTLVGTPAQNGLATGCYRYILTGTDNVGNTTTITTVVKVDLTDPTAPSLTLADSSADVHTTGTTAFYRPAGSGSFDVTASSTDAQSGIATYTFPTLTGFTLSGAGGARTYTLAAPTEADGAKTVTANNNAGRTNNSAFTLTADAAVPTGGAMTVNGGVASGGGTQSYDNDGTFTIGARTDYTDAISGIATSTLTREDGTLAADACSSYGAPSMIVGSPAQNSLATGCYRYALTGTDRVGNAVSISTVVKVDTSAPAAPGLTLADTSADVHTTGTTAFYRPAGSGSFDVTASSTDGQSGILDYLFPTLTGFTTSGSGASRTYTLATPTEPNGAKTVNARNQALLTTGSTFALTSDSTGPTGGALTVNGGAATGGGGSQSYDGDGSFVIDARTNYDADALSGFATSILTREDGTLAADACSSYGAPSTIVGTPAQAGLATGCYRYILTGTDNVGNTTTLTTVVKVDASDPTAPSLSLSDSSAAVHTTGTTAYYRPSGSGSFDVTASSTDAQSGIASYSFPSLAGFTTSGSGASRTFTLATPTEPDGGKSVSAQNNAGRSNSSTFTLTADSSDPTGGALVVNGVASSLVGTQSYDADGSFTIGTRTDYTDAISGIATSTLTREDGTLAANACSTYGAPATIVGSPAQNSLATGCYRFTLTGTDNVGNSSSRSTEVKVDLTDPTAPSLSLAESSAGVHTVGTTAFYRPAGAGSFDVTASSTDGQSGIAGYSFPTLAGFVASGSGATKTYTLSTPTEPDGAKTVTANNNVGRTNGSAFTLMADSTSPGSGSITANGGSAYDTDGTVALAKVDYADASSGIASQTLTRATATLANDACGSFAGTDPVTILGGNDTDTLATGCYRYTLTATDNVGNQAVTQSTIVKVDVTAPTAPTLALSNATGSAYYSGAGSTIWFRSAAGAGGSFDLAASSTDGQTAVASYAFPALGAGWSQSGSGASLTYTYANAAAEPGARNVTATNGAGGVSGNGTFTVANDTTPPTGGSITANGGSAFDGDGTVALVKVDFTDAGAGIAGHTLTRESATLTTGSCGLFSGSDPVTILGGNDADTLTTACYRYTLTGTDNVGSQASVQSTIVKVDTSAPSAPSLAFSNLSANARYAAGTLYIRPSAGGTFRVTATSIDPHTGVASYAFGSLNTNGGANFGGSQTGDQFDYTFSGTTTAPGTARTVTASNPAGGVSGNGSYSIVEDTTGPATILTDPGANLRGTVGLTAMASDAGAGVISVAFQRSPAGAGTWTTISTDSTPGDGFSASFDTTGPADGLYDLRALATDDVGNTGADVVANRRIDNTNPTGSVTAPADNANVSGSIALASSSADAGSGLDTVQFQRSPSGAGAWTNQATPWATTGVSDGLYDVRVLTTDNAGNSFTSAAITVRVDNTNPTGSITAPAGSASVRASIAVSSNSADTGGAGVDTVVFQRSPVALNTWTTINSDALAPYSVTFDTTVVGDGQYDLRAVTTDLAGNSSTSGLVTVTVDNTSPNTSIASQPADPTSSAIASFSFTSTEGGSTFECRIDSGVWGSCSSPESYNSLADGSHTFQVRATDATGNLDASPAAYTWLVDGTNPTGSVTAPAAASNLRGTVSLTSTSADVGGSGVATVQFQRSPIGTGTWTNQAASWDTTAQADGQYDLRVVTTDYAGNAFASATVTVRVDNTDPTGSVTAPANTANLRNTVALTSNSADAGGSGVDTVSFQRAPAGGGTWTNQAASWDTTAQADGQYDLRVVTTDLAGNSHTSATITVRVDNTNPTGLVTNPVAGADLRNTITLASSSADVGGSGVDAVQFQHSPAGAGTWTNQAASWNTNGVTDGQYDIRVVTTDLAGNSFTSAAVTARVDNTNPTGSVTAPADGANVRGTIGLTSNSADTGGSGVDTVQFQRSPAGAGTWTNEAASWDTTGVADGQYDARVVTTDKAGNGFASAAITVRVDNTNPTGTVTSPAEGANVRGTVSLTSNSADGGSGVATSQFQRSPIAAGIWTNQAPSWDTTAQGDGQYDLRVITTDLAGNTFTSATITVRLDNTAPTATMGNPGADLAGTITLTSTTNDGGSGLASVTYQRSPANAGTWTNQAASWDTTTVGDGLYDLRVIAVDNAGNSTTSALVEDRRVDNNAPAIDITAPVGIVNAAASDPFTVTASSPDFDLTQVEFFECPTPACGSQASIGVDTTAPYSISRAIPADGSWTLKVVATDNALNTMSDVETVTVDRTRPQTTIDSNPAAITNQTGAAFAFSSNDGGATFEVRLDGGAWIPSASPKIYSGLAEGPHTFDVRATDAAGNADLSPASYAWTVDTTAPNTMITGTPASPTNSTGATFSFSSSEGSSSFECRIVGGPWSACVTPQSYASLTEGTHTFEVRATDAATNTDATPASFSWTIDFTNPTGSVTSPAPGALVRLTILLASDSADGGSGVAGVVFQRSPAGAGTWTATPASWDTTLVSDGDYDLRVMTSDMAGNVATSSAFTVTVDNTPPNTSLTSQPVDPTNATGASFSLSSEAGASFEVRLDGSAWSPSASPKTFSGLADGSHTFEVRATDPAGNTDATPAAYTWTVDTTAPSTNITSQPADPTNATGASFSLSSNEVGSTFEVRLDGGAWNPSASPKTYAGLADGSHTFEVRATDPAGNTDATPATYTWTVDTIAPNSSFVSTPADPGSDTTPTFSFASTETPATYEVNLDGAGWVSASTPLTISPALSDGSHTLQLRASDAAGNQDATAAGYTWVVDGTNPTGSVTSPADGADIAGTVSLTSNSADAGSGVATVQFQSSPATTNTWTNQAASWNTTLETDGDYDLRVVTTDNAGNAFTSATITVTVDNTAPALSVNVADPINLTTPDPAPLSATATDAGSGIANVSFEQCIAANDNTCAVDTWISLGVDSSSPYGVSLVIPADGTRLLRVRATDNAGRQTTQLVLTTIDRTRPTGSLTVPAAGANVRGTNVVLNAVASDTAPGAINTVTFQRSPAGAGTWTDISVDTAAPYSATLDTTALGDGLYDLRVFTTDAAGNADATPATVQARVDNTLPTGSVTFPADAANVRGTVALTSNSADGGSGVATVQFQRSPTGAGTWTNQAASWDTTAQADGQYDVRVVTTDNAGNTFTSAAITVRVDNTLPTGTITAPANGADRRGTVALTSNSADGGSGVATVQFQRSPIGAGTWTNQAASWDTTQQTDGQYDLRVVTTDNAGNAFTSGAITIRVDNTLPTGTVTAPANGAEIGVPPVTLTGNSADPLVGGSASGVDTVQFQRSPAGANTWTTTPVAWGTAAGADAVADGQYDLRVVTTDKAGNSFASPVVTVLVDHTAPITSASLTPASPSNAPVTVSFSASDGAGAGIAKTEYRIDGGPLTQGTSVVVPAPGDHSNDGAHVVAFFSTDDVANVEAPAKTVNVVIDTTAPSGSGADPGDYLRGIANLSYSTGATDVSSVQFQFSTAGANSWANIGAADISPPYEAAWTTTLVADGPYDLRAVVTDTTGNVANTLLPGLPKTVDNTAPSGSVTSPGASAYVSSTVTVTASASDGSVPPASGVSAVRFEVKPTGAGAFTVFGTQTVPVGSTYSQALATTTLSDGPADIQVVVTDVAGNETTSATRTINIDNLAPVVTLADPGAVVGSSVGLTASSSPDTADVTFRYRPVGSGGAGTLIASDGIAPFAVNWTTTPAAETQWELIAVATDAGGNVTTSAPRNTLVDRTQPTGSVTSPSNGDTVGGPAVALAASAADVSGSGVTSVVWEVKEFGSGSFTPVATDTSAPYSATWNSTSSPDGATIVHAVITDAAGNVSTTAAVPFTLDSTGPSVSLADPGAVVSGTISLTATTGGGAARVVFSVSPAGASTWTQLANDTSAPFGTSFDTTTLGDGLYDLRAVGYDALDNASAPVLRTNVRLDNTAPSLVSSAPADGSISTSANQIVLTANEAATVPGALLDGVAAPAPSISGSTLTFATGALSDGLHVLSGELEDASGTRSQFRVAITIESSPTDDPPPVERSITSSGSYTVTLPGGLVTVKMPQSAWPTPPTPQDYILVLRVDAGSSTAAGVGFAPGTQIIEVTARWAIAGTYVTEFNEPLEITFSNPTGVPVIPVWSQNGTSSWTNMGRLDDTTLPATRRDGFHGDPASVHVLTRHLTFFGLMLDTEAPSAPRHIAGSVLGDGLTIRWIDGRDDSDQLGNTVLYVNGERYRTFGPRQYETKMGPFTPGDTRTFTLAQYDAAGNLSPQSPSLRAVPPVVGKSLEQAVAALSAAGFELGTVRQEPVATVAPGTVVGPIVPRHAVLSTKIDLVVSLATTAPQTRLVFAVNGSKQLTLQKRTTIATRIKVSRPANVTVTLFSAAGKQRLYTWPRLRVKAGANVVRLPLPPQIRRPGTYTLTWVARSGSETVSRSVKLKLVGRGLAQVKPNRSEIEVVLAGEQHPKNAVQSALAGSRARVVAQAGLEQTFNLAASESHNVGLVVVDVDVYGVGFISDLRTVFPAIRVIAVATQPADRVRALRAGAVRALPRQTTSRQLAKVIAAISSR
ncbi:MAG: large repetitive protein, partial [Gaiellaceae bacterium]|nr:large repetitive protein [Gaiellaceae bacterium]